MDPRAWPDIRLLIYQLEYGCKDKMPENWFERDTQKYIALMDKYAAQISTYTYLEKQKYFLKPF